MSKRAVNVEVSLSEVGGNTSRLIKKFIKKCKKERIIENYLERSRYIKPSEKRRIKRRKAAENARKAQEERDKKLRIRNR
tara:strand:- start:3102 stop:3341 length:240 start_codon:yes stop_codon:yes gene_type:complete